MNFSDAIRLVTFFNGATHHRRLHARTIRKTIVRVQMEEIGMRQQEDQLVRRLGPNENAHRVVRKAILERNVHDYKMIFEIEWKIC